LVSSMHSVARFATSRRFLCGIRTQEKRSFALSFCARSAVFAGVFKVVALRITLKRGAAPTWKITMMGFWRGCLTKHPNFSNQKFTGKERDAETGSITLRASPRKRDFKALR
jgi:hypothetical protein